jgi:hypothetical protein
MLNASFPIIIADVVRGDLAGFLEVLRGCWKASSLLWMQSNGLPVLPGVILNGWTPEAESAVARFCRERNFAELLVRIEKPDQRWTSQRGGYTVSLPAVAGVVGTLAREGMLAILLEPASPYSDLYSMSAVCDLHTGIADLEVVGPGFDASDILRGEITPHERFEFMVGKNGADEDVGTRRVYLTDADSYRTSVERRLTKIGAALRKPSLPSSISELGERRLAEEAVKYLTKTRQTLLLNHLDEYESIPERLLGEFLQHVVRLFRAVRSTSLDWKTLSVAGSFLTESRLVMWDFFAPDSYETTLLSRIDPVE